MALDTSTLALYGFVGVVGIYLLVNYVVLTPPKGTKSKKGSIERRRWTKFPLIKKTVVTHNTRKFRFGLPSSDHVLGLPTGKHIFIRTRDSSNEEVKRSYTPISSDEDYGYFELMIKIYPKGVVTQYLEKLQLGDNVEVSGPHGRMEYLGNGAFQMGVKKVRREFNEIGLIAGGTGITPMLALLRQVERDSNDNTKISLIFGNVSIDDILCRDELEQIRSNKNLNIKIYLTVDKLKENEQNMWNEGVGYVTKDMISKHICKPNDDNAVFICGPPIMCKILNQTLQKMDYKNIFEF